MSTVNAPMPDASGPAEVFDSTVAPPSGGVSSVGLPGPNNAEAPMHSGAMNGIDPFFHAQYMAITSFTWTTTHNPGTALWSIPIHPAETHQWLAHLSKMYNAWAGGINFAIKIAGTGFHAGAIMVVRVPPNIKPATLTTVSALTAFEYTVMDPKMLEVEIKSVMDQRNIMYHYMPLNVNDPQSFGGYLSIHVMLPLSTSSTGATEIAVQVLAQPAQNFMFTQIIPISREVVPVAVPTDLEDALDLRKLRTSLSKFGVIDKLSIWSKKTKAYLEPETLNAIKFDQSPMNGYFIPRLESLQTIVTPKELKTSKIVWVTSGDVPTNFTLNLATGDNIIAFNQFSTPADPTVKYPVVTGVGVMGCTYVDADKRRYNFLFNGKFDKVNAASDPSEIRNLQQKFTLTDSNQDPALQYTAKTGGQYFSKIYPEFSDNTEITSQWYLGISEGASYGFDTQKYAPPIPESLVTFDSGDNQSVYPFEFREALNSPAYEGFMEKTDSLMFELIDTIVDLPILPLKLHYSGFFTTILHQNDLSFKLYPARYVLRYTGRIKSSDYMVSGRQIAEYARNRAISMYAA